MKTLNDTKKLYSLIPYEEFKSVLSLDDRDENLIRFCLTIATHTIEQHCRRKFLTKVHMEDLSCYGERTIPLTHYPIQKICAVYIKMSNEQAAKLPRAMIKEERKLLGLSNWELLDSDYYAVDPEPGTAFDTPANLLLPDDLRVIRCEKSLRAVYKTGYVVGKSPDNPFAVPAGLSAACLELASWNFTRYKGKRIGLTGNVRGSGKDGEHLEMSMPTNVKELLQPYRRCLI
jgi:hypothetical protein